jgi:predicted enzyme related to lactoylglutathione lyase
MATKANPVNWFEIPVNDLSRAQAFYEHILGVKLEPNEMGPFKMAWFPMEREGAGAAGTLVKAEGYTPSHSGTLVYFSVDDIESVLKRVNDKKGKTILPKQSIGEYGFIALFEDTEGNRVGVHSMK